MSMSTASRSTLTTNATGVTAGSASTASTLPSSVGAAPEPAPAPAPRGPVAALKARAAVFEQCAVQAIAAAKQAAADAAVIDSAHASIVKQHRKLFLQKAFGLNPDGSKITNPALLPESSKIYRSVKSVAQYDDIVRILTNWGDDAVLAANPSDDVVVKQIKVFRANNKEGYNYVKYFAVRETEAADGSVKVLLLHKKTNGIVSHMLDIFDVIDEAHSRMGHMRVEKTFANCKPDFYSPTMELCKLFIEDCFVCHERQPEIPARKGAKKPILSSDFRDRIQVDLIDMRTMRKLDIYGMMQRWILTVKDHSTGLVYLVAIPRKKAVFVAAELEKYFGFIGFPHILHSDNGKEFIASLVVDMIMRNNPDCFIVTGRPRTPRDQGSVEIANKLVKRVLMRVCAQRRLQGIDTNWTRILGHVMAVCNSHSGTRKYSTSSYEAVFGQKFHPSLKCTVSEMRQCRTILQRLKLSPDERLETYVHEHDIVDPEDAFSSWEGTDDDDMDVGDELEEGIDISDNAFPEACLDDDNDDFDFSLFGAVARDKNTTQETSVISGDSGEQSIVDINSSQDLFCKPCGDTLSTSVPTPSTQLPEDDVPVTPKKAAGGQPSNLHDSPPATAGWPIDVHGHPKSEDAFDLCSESDSSDDDSSDDKKRKFRELSIFTLKEAWERGNIARPSYSLGDRRNYNFLWPNLTCADCCFPHGNVNIQVGEDSYIESMSNSQNWYDGIFMSSFAQLAAHYAHSTTGLLPERGMPVVDVLPKLIHVTYPSGNVYSSQCMALPPNITSVVAILHDRDHYGVLEVNVKEKSISIYDGLFRDMKRWWVFVVVALKRCDLCPLSVNPKPVPDEQVLVKRGRLSKARMSIEGYTFEVADAVWKFKRGNFIAQIDGFNCGPIACVKILEMFGLATRSDLILAYDMGQLRHVVKHFWDRFIRQTQNDLIVKVREYLPTATVATAVAATTTEPTVAAATTREAAPPIAAATQALEEPDNSYCFCYCDEPEMDLIRLQCCNNTVHRHCVVKHLMSYTQCAYCRSVVIDVVKVLDLPNIDRSTIESEQIHLKDPPELMKTSTMELDKEEVGRKDTPDEEMKTPTNKRSLQPMLVMDDQDKTPLRLSDQLRTASQGKKRNQQIEQAKKMMKMQGKDIADKGAAPGAVVVVQCPATAVSHPIGIMGIIYQLSKYGGARVATVAGILSCGNAKTNWWIPSDQYVVKYGVDSEPNILPELMTIREAILAGTYNLKNSAPKCTIQKAHQVLTDATSPCKVSRCNCKGGKCTRGRCGCIRKKSKCGSGCSCNGGCDANDQNGK